MSALTSTLVDICSAGAGRVWVDQCLAMPQWAQMAQYRTRYAALQSMLDEVSRCLEQGQDCHLCVLTPDAIRSLQSRWPERIDWIGSLGQAETGWVSLAGDGQSYDVATVLKRPLSGPFSGPAWAVHRIRSGSCATSSRQP